MRYSDDGKPFDQFEVNRQMGYVSTYNENLYTTALDMSKFSKYGPLCFAIWLRFREDLERAERTEKEILAKSHKKIIFGQEVDPDNMDESPCEDYEEEEEISFPSPKPIFQVWAFHCMVIRCSRRRIPLKSHLPMIWKLLCWMDLMKHLPMLLLRRKRSLLWLKMKCRRSRRWRPSPSSRQTRWEVFFIDDFSMD